ncbi:lytic murein transglycosylase B [Chitinasiproducens palmae]|uniref:Membrane-bound lytic murein transglycosylase B n=1 Tax=Chitinasiproducens palmae TaxID=1770053 RepID=A0A1H2PWX8_9BURK|nr:lytic murein transglycosylase B [Chitinasiproducens palmae]SDV51082.1 membrane-bound lytic murein transglycosylase B [Chitinasiproducens palmae]
MTVTQSQTPGQRVRRGAALSLIALATLLLSNGAAAQGQPETPTESGTVFEEEIVPQRYADSAAVNQFIDMMVARYDFNRDQLRALFRQASYSATAVKLITPAASPSVKNWQKYRSRFLDAVRINNGVNFWRSNRAALDRAAETYGVPPEYIVAIIGVETVYGRFMGNFRVLDVLTTLSFDYPNTRNRDDRQTMFRKNLEDFLVWTRSSNIDPLSVLGSYAGAIGIPQFMPTSIIQYAVDFDGSQSIDLRASASDAIGSVGNYLNKNGWERGRPVVWQIRGDAGSQGIAQAAADGAPEPRWSLDQLLRAGLLLNEPGLDLQTERGTPLTVVDLPTPGMPTQYALGLRNFYVITRYNRSFFYAMSVHELAQRIRLRMKASGEIVN